jgi:hypothetical protein
LVNGQFHPAVGLKGETAWFGCCLVWLLSGSGITKVCCMAELKDEFVPWWFGGAGLRALRNSFGWVFLVPELVKHGRCWRQPLMLKLRQTRSLRNPVHKRRHMSTSALAVVVAAFKLLGLGRQGNNFGHKQLCINHVISNSEA